MSLTSAFNIAFTGLKANSRAAGVISTNISNATNEAYGRRELGLSAESRRGVNVYGVNRMADPILVADRIVSDARLANSNDMYSFARRLEDIVGESGAPGSLTERVTAFENALLSASSNPASTQRLELVAVNARDLAMAMNGLSTEIQDARKKADSTIAAQVHSLNTAMVKLTEINSAVIKAKSTGSEVANLLDDRQKVLNQISEIVPLRVVEREKGDIAVYTRSGAVLLDGRVFEVGFTETTTIDANTTLANGQLSGLTLNGKPVNMSDTGMFSGGSLAAQFKLRDDTAPGRQAELDGIARDLIERLGAGGPDATLGATDPGLFTDNGLLFSAANEAGLAGRISINALIEPGTGESWRVRDGLGAATTGEVGDATLLQGLADALGELSTPSSSALPAVSRSFVDHMSQFASAIVGERVLTENTFSFYSAQNIALKEMEFSKGVDTDQELQTLMQVEQLYAANAKVISAVDGLFERILSI